MARYYDAGSQQWITVPDAPVGIADGSDVAEGSTTDAAGASTVVGQLKEIVAGPLTVEGSVSLAGSGNYSLETGGNLAETAQNTSQIDELTKGVYQCRNALLLILNCLSNANFSVDDLNDNM